MKNKQQVNIRCHLIYQPFCRGHGDYFRCGRCGRQQGEGKGNAQRGSEAIFRVIQREICKRRAT